MDRARFALYTPAAALLSLARPTRCGHRHTQHANLNVSLNGTALTLNVIHSVTQYGI
jgi:hypothetical protein